MRWFLLLLFASPFLSHAAEPPPMTPTTQTLQVNTHFTSVEGKPSWLLIVRDENSGHVRPYLFDIRNNDNFWVAFSGERAYRVTTSELKFGPFAKIHNFCKLENGIISGESFWISLRGELSPNPSKVQCHVSKHKTIQFTVVKNEPENEEYEEREEPPDAPSNDLRPNRKNPLSPVQPDQPTPAM